MELFTLAKESARNKFISNIINFQHINSSGLFVLPDHKKKSAHLILKERDHGVFMVYEKDIELCTIDINTKHVNRKTKNINPFKIPNFGITFLGVGSGFSLDKQNSSIIIWSEDKGILIDVVADHTSIIKKYGINNSDLNHILLTQILH